MSVLSELEALGQDEERVQDENRKRHDELLAKIKSGQATTGRRLLDVVLVWGGHLQLALKITVELERLEEMLRGQRGQLVLVVEKLAQRRPRDEYGQMPGREQHRFYLGVLDEELLPLAFDAHELRLPTARYVRQELTYPAYTMFDLGRMPPERRPRLVQGALVSEGWLSFFLQGEAEAGEAALFFPANTRYLEPVMLAGNEAVAEYFTQFYDHRELLSQLIQTLGFPFEQVPVLVEWREQRRADCRQKIEEHSQTLAKVRRELEDLERELPDRWLLQAAQLIRSSLKGLRDELGRAVELGIDSEPEIAQLLREHPLPKK